MAWIAHHTHPTLTVLPISAGAYGVTLRKHSMLRLSICFSLIITLGLALTACGGGGGSGGGSTAVPTTPVTSVNLNGTTFTLASCHDFSTTPVGALFERPNPFKVFETLDSPRISVSRIYEQVTGTTVGGVAIVGWFDGDKSVYAVDTAGAIRQIGTGVRTVKGVTVTLADRIASGTLPTFLPGGTLVNGQTFALHNGFGLVTIPSAGTATTTLNAGSQQGAPGCIKLLVKTPVVDPKTGDAILIYEEIWIKPGFGVLRTETYKLFSGPTTVPSSGCHYDYTYGYVNG
jgi:hypothetical protein